jgi:transcriptional regulator with XRE-family HTH domain
VADRPKKTSRAPEPSLPAPIIDPVDLGDRVRAKRRSRRLSIREAAAEVGVSAPTLSRVERGHHLPERENLLKIARWVGVRIDQVLYPGDARRARNRAVHGPEASTVEAVELHLRADPNLSRADAEALSELFRVAYETVSGSRPARKSRAR